MERNLIFDLYPSSALLHQLSAVLKQASKKSNDTTNQIAMGLEDRICLQITLFLFEYVYFCMCSPDVLL